MIYPLGGRIKLEHKKALLLKISRQLKIFEVCVVICHAEVYTRLIFSQSGFSKYSS